MFSPAILSRRLQPFRSPGFSAAFACLSWACLLLVGWGAELRAVDPPKVDTSRGDRMLANYFRIETRKLHGQPLARVRSLEAWQKRRDQLRGQLLEMLGLDPLPERTPLQATITGTVEHDEFVVEKLHFQSRPKLYVTGNLYRPKRVQGKLPAILYVCGHGRVRDKNGVSYGNKVHYQHHGAWFARHGYVCLTIDTLQLGEIEGIHHGTYREKMWWWLNRGYTPAGVEAWNCVRALDYLQSRDEVDGKRLGVTGRSGGGAYSWWIAAIDDRIQCAVPVAGITDLRNHVVAGMPGRFHDGCVEGHCDCMYMLNTYRWDYPQVAALIAPRPLLISNTDSDAIFPLDGVYRTFESVRRLYRLHKAADKVALQITAGGHADTQELRIHAFRWFNQHLRNDKALIEKPAVKFFQREQLKVFDKLPTDQINTRIHETFVTVAKPPIPKSRAAWRDQRDRFLRALKRKSFGGWASEPIDTNRDRRETAAAESQGTRLQTLEFVSQRGVRLPLYLLQKAGAMPERVTLKVLDEQRWPGFLASLRPAFAEQLKAEIATPADKRAFAALQQTLADGETAIAYVAPRGVGPTAWNPSPFKQTQHRRRFYLLGQTRDGMRVWDVRRAIQVLRTQAGWESAELTLEAHGVMGGVALYASLFEANVRQLSLTDLPPTHREGPILLNVRRYLDLPQAVAMAAERSRVTLRGDRPADAKTWQYAVAVSRLLDGKQTGLQLDYGEANAPE